MPGYVLENDEILHTVSQPEHRFTTARRQQKRPDEHNRAWVLCPTTGLVID